MSPSVYPTMLRSVVLLFVEVCVRVLYVGFGSKRYDPETFGVLPWVV